MRRIRNTRQDYLKGNPRGFLKNKFTLKVVAASVAMVISLGFALPSIAETTSLSARSSLEPAASIDVQSQAVLKEAQDCADPSNINSLASAQADTIADMQKMIMTPINTDNFFKAGSNNGCFDALSDFPNLSMTIPSLTGIAQALKQALVNYAVRKVCSAVNDALEGLIDPIAEVVDRLSDNGKIDLTGTVNKEMVKKMYEIDPELGRVSSPVQTTYGWSVADGFENSSQGKGGSGSTSVGSNTSNSTIGGSSNTASGGNGSGGNQTSPAKEDRTPVQVAKDIIDSIF